jgi:hypothetical protein
MTSSKAEINKEILKSIGKRGNSIDYNDVEEYLRNRYYDTARLYAPLYQQKDRPTAASRNGKNVQEKASNPLAPGQSTKVNEKIENKISSEPALNDQQQVLIVDDPQINEIDDDDSQIKYIYSLYKSRLSNNY